MSLETGSCPCGGLPPGSTYDECCGPLHRQERYADTPEQLMRSRYSAYVVGEENHLFRTWHPRTRPADLHASPDPGWAGLEIVAAPHPVDDTGVVEFVARRVGGDLHERSRFERRRGQWVYVDGDVTRDIH